MHSYRNDCHCERCLATLATYEEAYEASCLKEEESKAHPDFVRVQNPHQQATGAGSVALER